MRLTYPRRPSRPGARPNPPLSRAQLLYELWTIPTPAKPLFQAAAANFVMHSEAKVNTHHDTRGPLLLISGLEDHTVPDVVTRSTFKQFEGRGHSLTVDRGWKEVAGVTLGWLKANDL